MFLNNLNRNEKIAFITLAKELALTNNIIDEFEEKMLNDFKKELELTENVKEMSHDEAINNFVDSKNNVKRGVFTELLSISICNNDFNANTKEFSGKLVFRFYDHFGLDKTDHIDAPGFCDWFVLQHYDKFNGKYAPFITEVEFEVDIKGEF